VYQRQRPPIPPPGAAGGADESALGSDLFDKDLHDFSRRRLFFNHLD
jgi:hypothetical protein